MIIRDEAAMLPGFLASVAGLWDELVVADTGSRDGGPDLVRAAGGVIVDFPWIDDFAAARNASLAPARGRWIVCLDADERPDAELKDALRGLAGDPGAGAATLVMRNAMPGGGHRQARLLRCFRNVPEVRFRHRIHEDVADDVATWLARERLALRHLPGVVDHLGYVREVAAARDKKDRDTRLLRQALRDDPDDLYCRFKLLEVARFWDDQPMLAAEADAARRALERTPRARLAGRAWSGELAALVAQSLPLRPEAALAWLDAQAGRVEAGAAWHLRRGALLEAAGRLPEARSAFEDCLAACADPRCGGGVPAARPLLGLCRVAAGEGDARRAGELAQQAAALAPLDPEAVLAAVTFAGAGAPAFAAAHAQANPGAVTPLAQALLTAGRPREALELLDRCGNGDGLGVVVIALALGLEREVELALEPGEADSRLREWLAALWASGRDDLRGEFTANAAALAAAFPWVACWLQSRAAGLSPSRR